VDAAAFPAWAELPPAEKQAMFLRAADIVERRREEIIALLAAETGCAGAFGGFQVITAVRLLRQASNWGYLPVGEIIRSDMPGSMTDFTEVQWITTREGAGHFPI
jgi:acyl-CoA reductase-like NAD-dependent aldehyde dehydrogenase